jgi:hypothetical protein
MRSRGCHDRCLTRLRLRPTRRISWRGWCKWTPVEPAGTRPGYKSSRLEGSEDPWTTGARDELPRSVAEVLREHVVLEVEAIDRMYLNVYVPHLQSAGPVVGYLRVHRGQRFASTTAMTPMTEAFVRNIDQFINQRERRSGRLPEVAAQGRRHAEISAKVATTAIGGHEEARSLAHLQQWQLLST